MPEKVIKNKFIYRGSVKRKPIIVKNKNTKN